MQNNPIKCERKTYVNQDDQLTTSAQWAIKSLEKYKIFSVKIDIRFFFPSIFCLLCIILIVIVVCIVIYTLWQNQKCMNWVQKDLLKIFLQVWTEMAKKNALQAVYEYRWQIYLHISKSVLIENYLLIEYLCEFFFLILVKTFK